MTGSLEHLDPTTLVIADNVRDDAALDRQFLASVGEHGVLQPITAVRTEQGEVWVRDGQRRTLAAREAALPTIPVYVLDGAGTNTAARIAHQIVTNDQRAALTDAQRARGIHQMLLSGVSAAKVAKALSVDRGTVTAARAAAESPAAMSALDTGQLNLTEAAALVEFQDDPEGVQALVDVAGTAQFDHRVAQLRQVRESARARILVEKDYAIRGFTVLNERPDWRDTTHVALQYLRTADGHGAGPEAVTDPTRWAVLLNEDTVLLDPTTGERVEDAEVDWMTERDPERAPAPGARHADTVIEQTVWDPDYYCLDAAACGLTLAEFLTQEHSVARQDDEPPQADAEAVDEIRRAERRKVLALNKLGLAAQDVRRAFVRDQLLARKAPLKGGTVFVAASLEQSPALLAEHGGRALAADLLGLAGATLHDTVGALTAGGDARARTLLLGMVLAALEARTPKDAWRTAGSRYVQTPGAAEYLRFLADNGYTLSDVERVVIGEVTGDDVHRALT